MRKRKLRQGDLILSIDHFIRCDWVIIRGKPYHHGWVASWPLRIVKLYISNGIAYEGIRLTNGQYYPNIKKEEAERRFRDELISSNPCLNSTGCPFEESCQDEYCYKSFNNWLAAPVS